MSRTKNWILIVAAICIFLIPQISSGLALLLGIVVGLFSTSPPTDRTKHLIQKFLPWSVIGLGGGMNLASIAQAGIRGFGYTFVSITIVLALGFLIGRVLLKRIPIETTWLVTVGTAICGGSAIAALAPVLRAKSHDVSVSLAIVFLLNSIALFIFPPLGHFFHLTEEQFGLWSALAIHDTSSVVGATLQYGSRALEIGTAIKLARALWIVPVVFIVGQLALPAAGDGAKRVKAKRPWFILGFVLFAAIVTYFPILRPAGSSVAEMAKRLLVVTLFLIGTTLQRANLKAVGVQPFLLGGILWILVATSSLFVIVEQWIAV